ncbi:hypothetical protein FDP41_012533 [Naegleria fowleri]|uniref:Uncharacterized protein n=1 Tax=Naegleria fowleri TaxID=5763 RepID=A0A6A5BT62_NAEFO|nr:uncharacterized protein FDP41_012533 [Naegleria fowleri]KAF0981273.1 hypothetical protein FDP41_012533 [Naegleria fowleri]CAG4713009.1 unnamed protein product [Naegleria fowleri]
MYNNYSNATFRVYEKRSKGKLLKSERNNNQAGRFMSFEEELEGEPSKTNARSSTTEGSISNNERVRSSRNNLNILSNLSKTDEVSIIGVNVSNISKSASKTTNQNTNDLTATNAIAKKKKALRELWTTLRSLKSNYDESKHACLFQIISNSTAASSSRFRRNNAILLQKENLFATSSNRVSKRSSTRRRGHFGGRWLFSPNRACLEDDEWATFPGFTFNEPYDSHNYYMDNTSDRRMMLDHQTETQLQTHVEDLIIEPDDPNYYGSFNSYTYQHEEFPPRDTKLYDSASSSTTAFSFNTLNSPTHSDDISIDLNGDNDDDVLVDMDFSPPTTYSTMGKREFSFERKAPNFPPSSPEF